MKTYSNWCYAFEEAKRSVTGLTLSADKVRERYAAEYLDRILEGTHALLEAGENPSDKEFRKKLRKLVVPSFIVRLLVWPLIEWIVNILIQRYLDHMPPWHKHQFPTGKQPVFR